MAEDAHGEDILARQMQAALEVRRRVTGPNYTRRQPLDPELSNLIVKYAFGEVWSRPGLEIESRRLLAMAFTIGGNHLEEFKLHVGFALNAGMSRETIKEIVMQSAIYCGVPAAIEAFYAAEEAYALFNPGPCLQI